MEIKIKAEEIISKRKKIEKEFAAINEATQKMLDQLEKLMPIMMDDEHLFPTDYTFEPEVISSVNSAGYAIIPDDKIKGLFLMTIG